MNMLTKILLVLALMVAVVTGCGGGGSASEAVTAPAIATQPASLSVTVGAAASLTVVATGSTPLTYQWYKAGTALAGATSATYTLATTATTDAGSYTVVVGNSAGTTTSSPAVLTVTAHVTTPGGAQSEAVAAAAQAFQATLSTAQQASLTSSWAVDTARRWSNLPASMVSRNGLSWGNLTTAQKAAARVLITTALGSTGNALHEGLQAADDVLVSQYSASSSYGNGNYYIAFVGTPSATGFWVLQLTGHHLTFNIAVNGAYKSATPLFLGVEPKGAFTLNGTTHDPMAAQREAMANLGAVLPSYTSAKLAGTYGDLLFGANGAGNIDGTCPRAYASVTERGALYSSLSAAHQQLAQAVIKAYVSTQSTDYSTELLTAYLSDTALAQTYVAYAGSGTVTTNGDYFRIEGPRVWIEFSVQRGILVRNDIHFHTIWRDKLADYGGTCQ